jgi:septum formation inhibitor MinC
MKLPTNFSAATVTETALLRSQLADLQNDIEAMDKRMAELSEWLKKGSVIMAVQEQEIHGLRRQVKALRDGAILEEDP